MHAHNKNVDQTVRRLIDKTNKSELGWTLLESNDEDYQRIQSTQQGIRSEKLFVTQDGTIGETFICAGPNRLALYRIKDDILCLQPATEKYLRCLFVMAEKNFDSWVESQILAARCRQLSEVVTVRELFNAVDHDRLAEEVTNEITYQKIKRGEVVTDTDIQESDRTAYRAAKDLIRAITESPDTEAHGWLTLVEQGPAPLGWSVDVPDSNIGNYETDLHIILCPSYDECPDEYREWATSCAAKIILLSVLDN